MACNSFTRHGFGNISSLMTTVDSMLTTNTHQGLQDPSFGYFNRIGATTIQSAMTSEGTVVYEATTNIDPLANFTPVGSTIKAGWRMAFRFYGTPSATRMAVFAATELQIKNDGTIVNLTNRQATGSTSKDPAGLVGAPWNSTTPAAATDANSLKQVFLNTQYSNNADGAYPMSFTLTLTNRGIFFSVWEANQEESPQEADTTPEEDQLYQNSPIKWFLIQRPVDRTTGHVRGGGSLRKQVKPSLTNNQANDANNETSRCPVYCVFGFGAPNEYRRFVVREMDVLSPSRKRDVTEATEDCNAMINKYQQQSITETGEFVVTFLNNLTTSRYRYGDELDMLGTVGAEVIGAGTAINVQVYSENVSGTAVQRTYTALYSNNPYGVGMRLMALTAANTVAENSHVTSS